MAKSKVERCDGHIVDLEREKFRQDDTTGDKFVAVTDPDALEKLCEIRDNLNSGLDTKVAAETISALKVLKLDNPTDVNCADTDTCPNATVYGVARVAAAMGSNVEIVRSGNLYDSSFNYPVNTPLFLGAGGVITDTAPATGFLTQIGHSGGPGLIIIEITDPVEL